MRPAFIVKCAIRLFVLLLIATVAGCINTSKQPEGTEPLTYINSGEWDLRQSPANKFTPVQLSLWPPIQLVPGNWDVYGLRLALPCGDNRNVTGMDLGVINLVAYDASVSGVQVGMFVEGWRAANGVQVGLLESLSGNVNGVQIAGLANGGGNVRGVQIAGLSSNADQVDGVQLALLLNAGGFDFLGGFQRSKLNGLQLALFNVATDEMCGAQIGLLNYAGQNSSGVQFGLLNFIKHGFLPFFPLINFNFSRPSAQQ